MEHQPRGLLLQRDELAGWIAGFGQYKSGKKGDADSAGDPATDQLLGIEPVMSGTEMTAEGLFVGQHETWRRYLLAGLAAAGGTR